MVLLVNYLECDLVGVTLEFWGIHAGDASGQGAELSRHFGADAVGERVFAAC